MISVVVRDKTYQKGPEGSPKQRHNKAPKACADLQDVRQSDYTFSSKTLTILRT